MATLKLLLLTISVVLVTAHQPTYRGNIAIGDKNGTHLIYHKIHEKFGLPLMIRDEDIKVKGIANEFIKAIVISDLKGGGRSDIMSGGVGRRQVAIKLESGDRGHGYNFLVEVYAL